MQKDCLCGRICKCAAFERVGDLYHLPPNNVRKWVKLCHDLRSAAEDKLIRPNFVKTKNSVKTLGIHSLIIKELAKNACLVS